MPVYASMSSRQNQFEALVRGHSTDLYRYAYWLCGQDALAQDLVQDTFLRAWRALDKLREVAAVKAGLLPSCVVSMRDVRTQIDASGGHRRFGSD